MRTPRLCLAILSMLLLASCAGRTMMPTPNQYVGAEKTNVFRNVPAQLRSNEADLLYVTDREPEKRDKEALAYGFGRSPSSAFGSVVIEIGKDLQWEKLVALSLTNQRSQEPELRLKQIIELGRYPKVPFPSAVVDGVIQLKPEVVEAARDTEASFHAELRKRLRLSSRSEAVIYIHGYNNSFEYSAYALADLWHFLGREHLAILYSWPAGHGGPGGYAYDRESGEFTIFHLKSFLRSLASLPDIDKIHIIAHSRGADIAVTALRELFLEALADRKDPRRHFRIENLVLAAPDMDSEVLLQRVYAEHLERGIGEVTLFTSQKDKAIFLAEHLFGSDSRLGRLQREELTEEGIESLENVAGITFVEYEGKSRGLGHSYFHFSPAVSSDLILAIRYGLLPGAEGGRPMQPRGINFWAIDSSYPADRPEQ